MTEFNLSKKKIAYEGGGYWYPEEDIKTFIKKLKEDIPLVFIGRDEIIQKIDKLAGEDLI